MIFSIANLACHMVADTASHLKGLGGVKFEKDGTTVGCNERIIMAVSPADEKRAQLPANICEPLLPPREGFLIAVDLVVRVIKNLSRMKKLPLVHVRMTRMKDIHRVGFTSVNENGDPTTTASLPMVDKFPLWRNILGNLMRTHKHRVVINRDDLIQLLKAMDSAAPLAGKGVSPVYMEVGDKGIVLYTRNYMTQQTIVGGITSIDTGGKWLEGDFAWVAGIKVGNAGKLKPTRNGNG